MDRSRFPKPASAPIARPTRPAAYDALRVKSDEDMVAALNAIAARFNVDDPLRGFGAEIVVVQPFVASSAPYFVPGQCPGVRIRSAGRFPITAPSAAVAALFKVQAIAVTIDGFFVLIDGAKYFTTFVEAIDETFAPLIGQSAPRHGRVLDNIIQCDRMFVDSTTGAGASSTQVRGNAQMLHKNGAHAAPILLNSLHMHASDNDLLDGGGDAITIGARGGSCTSRGNDCAGADITSSASLGHNTISANMNVGLVTAAATDRTNGDNSP